MRSLAAELAQSGRSVFWDRRIPAGQTWRSHIGKALRQARCVVVVWSAPAIESDWVIEEADQGKQRGVLVPVLREVAQPPLGFGHIQAADLSAWSPGVPTPAFDALISDLETVLGPAPSTMTEIAIDHGPATLVELSVSKDPSGPAAEAPRSTPERHPRRALQMRQCRRPHLLISTPRKQPLPRRSGPPWRASKAVQAPATIYRRSRPQCPPVLSRWTRLKARPSTRRMRDNRHRRASLVGSRPWC